MTFTMRSRLAITLALVLACTTAGALNADQLADAKKLIPAAQLQLVNDFNNLHKLVLDPGKLACYKSFNDSVTAAQTAFKHCVNSPSANSPLGKFNALTNAQLASFCGNKTLSDCVAGVMTSQRAFCADQTDLTENLAAAEKAQAHCLQCDTLHDKLTALEADFVKAGCARRLVIQP